MISLDKFTVKAQEAMASAQGLAFKGNNTETYPLHMLSALLRQEDGVIGPLLQKMGVAVLNIQDSLDRSLKDLPRL